MESDKCACHEKIHARDKVTNVRGKAEPKLEGGKGRCKTRQRRGKDGDDNDVE
jgi:hypothetical protein